MLSWLNTLLETLLGPLGRWLQRFWAKRRVRKYVQELSGEQREELRLKHRIADESPSRLYVDTITGGGGPDMTENFLYQLLEEEAIVSVKHEERDDGGFSRTYRFKPWFHDYLSEHPQLLNE